MVVPAMLGVAGYMTDVSGGLWLVVEEEWCANEVVGQVGYARQEEGRPCLGVLSHGWVNGKQGEEW
jgi:hypothetical protein